MFSLDGFLLSPYCSSFAARHFCTSLLHQAWLLFPLVPKPCLTPTSPPSSFSLSFLTVSFVILNFPTILYTSIPAADAGRGSYNKNIKLILEEVCLAWFCTQSISLSVAFVMCAFVFHGSTDIYYCKRSHHLFNVSSQIWQTSNSS